MKSTDQKINNIIRYHINYKQYYEKQLAEKGKIESKAYLVEVPGSAIAIASFIIGAISSGFTYDVAKTALKKIINKYKPKNKSEKEFIIKIKKESNGLIFWGQLEKAMKLEKSNKQIEKVIYEEQLVEAISKHITKLPEKKKGVNHSNHSNILKIITAGIKEIKKDTKLSSQEIDQLKKIAKKQIES